MVREPPRAHYSLTCSHVNGTSLGNYFSFTLLPGVWVIKVHSYSVELLRSVWPCGCLTLMRLFGCKHVCVSVNGFHTWWFYL